jgi:hypothetical protein
MSTKSRKKKRHLPAKRPFEGLFCTAWLPFAAHKGGEAIAVNFWP